MSLVVSPEMLVSYDSVVAKLATRAEDLTNFGGTFVETIYPEILVARQHQIIYGRRGTGKTHLLRRVEVSLRDSFAEGGLLPVYVNGSQLSQQINLLSSNPDMVALAIYVQLMQHIGTEIHRFVMELNRVDFWDWVVGGKKSQNARQADVIATLLKETLTSGQVRLLPAGEASDEATTLAETSQSASAGASIKLDPRTLGWAIKADAAAARSKASSSLTTRKIRGEVILPFSQVSSDLARLLELLGQASILVFFDEWSEVDKDPRVQPYLAEMLRRTTSAVPGMYLKLACIPGRTSLATPITGDTKNPIGLEEGDDIQADVDLDSIVFSQGSLDQLVPFFMAMIKKHVGVEIDWVRDASFRDFKMFLTSKVFKGLAPFVELCQASGGVPRDFINIYRTASITAANINKSGQVRPPFNVGSVRHAAKGVYQSKRKSFGKSASPQLQLLDTIYKEIYINKNSYLFLLSEESAEDDIVQTLYMEKLIHRMPVAYYNTDDERRYQYFQLDYGATIDRLVANAAMKARTSYDTSVWAKLASLGGAWLTDAVREVNVGVARLNAFSSVEAGRLDIEPREIIFPDNKVKVAARISRLGEPRTRSKRQRARP